MPYEPKDDTFSLFKNDKTNDAQPDLTGNGKIGGRDVKLACWKKMSQSGKPFYSCKVEDKDSFKG